MDNEASSASRLSSTAGVGATGEEGVATRRRGRFLREHPRRRTEEGLYADEIVVDGESEGLRTRELELQEEKATNEAIWVANFIRTAALYSSTTVPCLSKRAGKRQFGLRVLFQLPSDGVTRKQVGVAVKCTGSPGNHKTVRTGTTHLELEMAIFCEENLIPIRTEESILKNFNLIK